MPVWLSKLLLMLGKAILEVIKRWFAQFLDDAIRVLTEHERQHELVAA